LVVLVVGASLLAVPSGARAADAAVLFGLMNVGGVSPAFAGIIGHAPSVAGFEIEYLGTKGEESGDRTAVRGIFGNLIVHPATVGHFQFFAIFGFGVWGETLADGTGTGAFGAKDIGGGAKVRLTDWLKLRLDYRLFLLGEPQETDRLPGTKRPHRLSMGLHVAFK
jgi:hypothetical protein